MPESIGHKLKAAREFRRLTLDQAAEITRIRAPYLRALENDDYSAMLSAAQGRGFLRLYSDFLGLNLDELTASARDNKPVASAASAADSTPAPIPTPEPTPAPDSKPSRPGFWSRLLRRNSVAEEEAKPVEEPAPVSVDAPLALAESTDEAKLVTPTRKTSLAKKSARKKPATTEDQPKSAARKAAAGKKKHTTQ